MRKIVHVDMDAFYASVEQRDNPDLRGKPVIVGGPPESRSVVCTCSYEARKFGVHSAMPSRTARKLCPQGIFILPRMKVYVEVSRTIHRIFHDYTDLVEPLSLDEAYLDVTDNKRHIPSATVIAREIKARIQQKTGLSASAGVSYNKFIAKIASDMEKPDGLTLVRPEEARQFIDQLPVGRFFGVGKVTEEKMKRLGIYTGKDLYNQPEYLLIKHFGKSGTFFYQAARGIDLRPVEPSRPVKSVGRERTLEEDITDPDQILRILEELAVEVEEALQQQGLGGFTLTVKIKDCGFQSHTRSLTVTHPLNRAEEIRLYLPTLLERTVAGTIPLRLLGVTVSGFPEENRSKQLLLPFVYNSSSPLSC